MKFLIPSRGRCGKLTTVDLLIKYGVSPVDICLGVSNNADFEAYTVAYNPIHVVASNRTNLASTLNALLAVADDGFNVIMDDDVIYPYIFKLNKQHKNGVCRVKATRKEFFKQLQGMQQAMQKNNARIGVFRSNDNALFGYTAALKHGVYQVNAISSMWCALVRGGIRFNEDYPAKEDYELQIREYASGNTVIRGNMMAPYTRSRSQCKPLPGGRDGSYSSPQDKQAEQMLLQTYGPLIKKAGKHSLELAL